MRAFVTGGSGFIGGVLVRRLVKDGVQVTALARSESSAEKVRALGAEPFVGDLNPIGKLADGAQGCDVAYHAAAFVEQWGPWSEFQSATVDGTANMLEACRRAGVKRFVHVGTEAALVDGNALVNADETWPLKPDSRAYYPRSKARAEQAVVSANGVDGMETVVVRPRFVWGPGDTTLLPGIVDLIRNGKFAWVGGGGNLTSTAHVDNVVEGLVLAAEKGRGGEAYFVTDGDPIAFKDMVTAMVASEGVEPGSRNVPAAVAKPAAALAEGVWRTLRLKGGPPITRLAVWNSALECTVNDAKAREELGYRPVISLADGLAALSSSP
jgi:nucleoside-diphosphate-sugar epimerase